MSGPTAGPMTRTSRDGNRWTEAASRDNSPAKDSRSSRSHYVTADRLYETGEQMSDSDWQVLAFVSGVRLATGKQLVRQFWPGDDRGKEGRAGRKALKRLRDWRVLDALPQRIGRRRPGSDSLVYGVGLAGVKLLVRRGYTGRRPDAPGSMYVAHMLALTEVVISLHERDRAGILEVLQIQSEPQCWRAFLGSMGARRTLKPDLFFRLGADAYVDHWFLEVDLGTESSTTILSKAMAYVAYRASGAEQAEYAVFPRVLFTVPDDHRGEQIEAALDRLRPDDRQLFEVCRSDQLTDYLAREARA